MSLVVRYTSQPLKTLIGVPCAIIHVDESLYNSNLTAQYCCTYPCVFMLMAVPSYVCRDAAKRAWTA